MILTWGIFIRFPLQQRVKFRDHFVSDETSPDPVEINSAQLITGVINTRSLNRRHHQRNQKWYITCDPWDGPNWGAFLNKDRILYTPTRDMTPRDGLLACRSDLEHDPC